MKPNAMAAVKLLEDFIGGQFSTDDELAEAIAILKAATTPTPSLLELVPEWTRLRKAGWRFKFDHETGWLAAEHPEGGGIAIAEFRRGTVLANQIATTVAHSLNEPARCNDCQGLGQTIGDDLAMATCPECQGEGLI